MGIIERAKIKYHGWRGDMAREREEKMHEKAHLNYLERQAEKKAYEKESVKQATKRGRERGLAKAKGSGFNVGGAIGVFSKAGDMLGGGGPPKRKRKAEIVAWVLVD